MSQFITMCLGGANNRICIFSLPLNEITLTPLDLNPIKTHLMISARKDNLIGQKSPWLYMYIAANLKPVQTKIA
jgi:hypothetical protein